jgi:serine/threonine protein kinase
VPPDSQIKPENILLSKDRTVVKLCDFGVSEMFDAKGSDRIKKAGGSPAFLSPESFTCKSGHGLCKIRAHASFGRGPRTGGRRLGTRYVSRSGEQHHN